MCPFAGKLAKLAWSDAKLPRDGCDILGFASRQLLAEFCRRPVSHDPVGDSVKNHFNDGVSGQ
jgi:hypothetical protein